MSEREQKILNNIQKEFNLFNATTIEQINILFRLKEIIHLRANQQ